MYTECTIRNMNMGMGDDISISYFSDILLPSISNVKIDKIINANNFDKYSPFDIKVVSNNVPYFFELKARKKLFTDSYPDWGLSVKKYNTLLSLANMYHTHCYYVNFFVDGWCYWDLTKNKPIRYGEWVHSATTEFNRQNKIKEENVPYFQIHKIMSYIYE